MKVLIITYYWPPAGGSGVQRWLYFVKYLREFGIEPIVFTISNPKYPIIDKDLATLVPENTEIIRQNIFEPNRFFGKNNKKATSGFLQKNPTTFQKLAQYIRANYFIPDARKFWIAPSVRKLKKYLKQHPVDWIITTGPPHSVHLIGQRLKEKSQIKWLADFRDPWTEIDYFHQLPLTKRSLKKHKSLEKKVLTEADLITVVGNTMKEKYDVHNSSCKVITNGFDDDGIEVDSGLDDMFTLTHIGMLNADRNPLVFWESIREILDENPEFESKLKINLIGKVADEAKDSIRKYDIQKYISYTNYIPHNSVLKHQKRSQVLLLFVNQVPNASGIITGKVFEYLQAKRPILALAPIDGDLARIINETNSGNTIAFNDKKNLKKCVLSYFEAYLAHDLKASSQDISIYHRKNLTRQLAELLKNN